MVASVQQTLKRSLLAPLIRRVSLMKERRDLGRVSGVSCDTSLLGRPLDAASRAAAFTSPALDADWARVSGELDALAVTQKAGGVNPGDRRALYYLLRHLGTRSVLEVGTHVGASTVHVVAALRDNAAELPGEPARMVTVDISDVNDPATRPWVQWGSTHAPAEMVRRLGGADWVSFVTRDSVDYLAAAEERFDLIFLDGNHSARTVYREVPTALRLLNPGGVLLLHDYYPGLRPLWSDGSLIAGPVLGTERLRAEGARFTVLPLGELPWQTKRGSRVTSLALVVGV